jgi:hypothetical protein
VSVPGSPQVATVEIVYPGGHTQSITYENGHQVSATPLLPQRVRGKLANRLQAAVYFRANP